MTNGLDQNASQTPERSLADPEAAFVVGATAAAIVEFRDAVLNVSEPEV